MAAQAGATVVATHIRLAPRVRDPEPVYPGGVVHDVRAFLAERAHRAEAAGIPKERIVDRCRPGPRQDHAAVGGPAARIPAPVPSSAIRSCSRRPTRPSSVSCSVSQIGERRDASLAAAALGVAEGCRILRVHDVAGTCRVRDVLAAVLEARVAVAAGPS